MCRQHCKMDINVVMALTSEKKKEKESSTPLLGAFPPPFILRNYKVHMMYK